MRKSNNFDFIAPYYDRSVKLVFGRSLFRLEVDSINAIRSNSRILVIGGGTGRILPLFSSLRQVQIVYIEKSEAMIEQAKERTKGIDLDIEFLVGDIRQFSLEEKFNYILTSFFLDCFESKGLQDIIDHCEKALVPGGCWIINEFSNKGMTGKLLIKSMYIFFRLVTNLEASRLEDYPRLICDTLSFRELCRKESMEGLIYSTILMKSK
jgi:ubiquinone/menaquinone biosynthesis C-methylase UbiE